MGSEIGERDMRIHITDGQITAEGPLEEILDDLRSRAFFHPASLGKRNIHEQIELWRMYKTQLACALAQDVITQKPALGRLVEGTIKELKTIDDTYELYEKRQGGLPSYLLYL